jgi:hypothetical protein
MKLSAVIVSRNDNYGGHLIRTANFCLNSMLKEFDEVVYVDWNSPGGVPLTDVCEIYNRDKLKVIVVSEDDAKRMCPDYHICEVIGRNIGIRNATGDYIVSTNIDIIPPKRSHIDAVISEIPPKSLITIASNDTTIEVVEEVTKNNSSVNETLPYYIGVNPVTKNRCLSPFMAIDNNILNSVPAESKFHVTSVIMSCGDFQIAHRDTWFEIKGFEESMLKRGFADGVVQHKIIKNGGKVIALVLPPVYNIQHERTSDPSVLNDIKFAPDVSLNTDDWGVYQGRGTSDGVFVNTVIPSK